VGLATPRTHETTSPAAGTQRDYHSPSSPVDAAPSSNGRIALTSETAGSGQAQSQRPATPSITLECALYGVILIAAVLTRFWDLGSRALHHDESLHAYFSWLLATGQGYVHDPLMHGPFLFHFTALIFALFGDSDAASRFGPALFGVILIALPILLRGPRHLGRWGALTASALILISPSLLYQSRYLRHDIFTVAGALLLLIAIVRYVERPSRGWLIAIGVTVGFLLTNHEIVFGIVAIFVAVIAGALLWGNLRPLAPVLVAAGVVAVALVAYLPDATGRPLPEIPWSHPTQTQQFDFYRQLLTNPLTIALALLAVITIAGSMLVLRMRYDAQRTGESWAETLFGDAPSGSIAAAVREAWLDRVGLSTTLMAGLFIFAVLFTTLFTNLYGLASGTISTDGTLLYWLGQHDYRRGEQPWFYYALLLPQYEFIAVSVGTIATIFIGVRMLLVGLGRAKPGPRFIFQSFLAIWFVGILLALSWAGEKMPWLVTHISLPAVLLAAVLLGEVWERWRPVIRETGDGRRETGGGRRETGGGRRGAGGGRRKTGDSTRSYHPTTPSPYHPSPDTPPPCHPDTYRPITRHP
jgi:predicted membrane-bound mannosyltransferase